MKEELNKILGNVNDWLKFAETKNAVIIAFNGAAISAILQSYPENTKSLKMFEGIMLTLFALSICISIYSFLPILKNSFKYKKLNDNDFEAEKAKLNCYFFRDHSRISCNQLLNLLIHKSSTGAYHANNMEIDIAEQIISNAEIAMSKFVLFSTAAYITFSGVVMGLIVILIQAF
jgi:hypothetical protein